MDPRLQVLINEIATDVVTTVLNKAQSKLKERISLYQFVDRNKHSFSIPQMTSFLDKMEKYVEDLIVGQWMLSNVLMFCIKFRGKSHDECFNYYYFEVIFSQPTVSYPIPQASVSVFFRFEINLTEPLSSRIVPVVIFRIEGHQTEYDTHFVSLPADWLLAELEMKRRFFKRIENYKLF